MRVVATKAGFYNRLHSPGDEFEVTEKTFSKTWMKKITKTKAEKPPAEPKADNPPEVKKMPEAKDFG